MDNQLKIIVQAELNKQAVEARINEQVKQLQVDYLKIGVELDTKSAKSAIIEQQKQIQKEINSAYKQRAKEDSTWLKKQQSDADKYHTAMISDDKQYFKSKQREADQYRKQNQQADIAELNRQRSVQDQLNKYRNASGFFGTQDNKAQKLGINPSELTSLKEAKTLWAEINSGKFKGMDSTTQIQKLNKYRDALKDVSDQMRLLSSEKGLESMAARDIKAATTLETHFLNLRRSAEKYRDTNKRLAGSKEGNDLNDYIEKIKLTPAQGGFQNFPVADNALKKLERSAKDAGLEGQDMWQKIQGAYVKFGGWAMVTGSLALLRRGFSEMVSVVQELDKSFVNIQMVTGGTTQETTKLMQSYNQLAQKIGATTQDVATSANEFLRQGLSIADTNKLIETSMVLSKIGMLSSADATQYLTSAMKGYKISAEDAMKIVDQVSSIDMVSATSAGGIMEAMSRTANGARLAGIEMQKLEGYIAAVGEVTQKDMSTVGESFKSIFARMSNIKLGKLEDEDGENITEYLSDAEEVLDRVDIKLRKSATEFNNFGGVLDQLGGKWQGLNDIERNTIATAFAGKICARAA